MLAQVLFACHLSRWLWRIAQRLRLDLLQWRTVIDGFRQTRYPRLLRHRDHRPHFRIHYQICSYWYQNRHRGSTWPTALLLVLTSEVGREVLRPAIHASFALLSQSVNGPPDLKYLKLKYCVPCKISPCHFTTISPATSIPPFCVVVIRSSTSWHGSKILPGDPTLIHHSSL